MSKSLKDPIIHEGNLTMLIDGQKPTKKRYFVLYKGSLVCYSSKKEFKQRKPPLETISLENCKCYPFTPKKKKKNKYYFRLVSTLYNENHYFMTERQNSGLVWPRKITYSITNTFTDALNKNTIFPKLNKDSTKGLQTTLNKVQLSQKGQIPTFNIKKQQNSILVSSLITKIDDSKVTGNGAFIEIEYSTINSIRMLAGCTNEYKLLFRRSRSTQTFILSDNLYQIMIIFSILNLLKSNLSESIFQKGSISSKDKINQLFFPLIGSIFEKCLDIINNNKTINLNDFTKTQITSLKSATQFLNQADPLLIPKENNFSSQSLFSLILIFQSICWRFRDPFFPKNFQKLFNLFDTELSDEENINNIFQILSTIDTFNEKIIGGIFLIYHLLFKEINDQKIQENLIVYLINLIHFNIISSQLDANKISSELEKNIPLIKFLIHKTPIFFYNIWEDLKKYITSEKKIEIDQKTILLHQEKKEKSKKFVSISNLIINNQKGGKLENNSYGGSNSDNNSNSNTNNIDININKIEIRKEKQPNNNLSINNPRMGSDGAVSIKSIKSMDSLDFLLNDDSSISQNGSSFKSESVSSSLSKGLVNRYYSKSQIKNTNEKGTSVEDDDNELQTLLDNRHLFYQNPLPLLPLKEKNHDFIKLDHNASKAHSELIGDILDEECSGIWKAVETLELFNRSQNNKNDINLFVQILELLCFEISWIGVDACKIHEKSLELSESIIEYQKNNNNKSFSLLDALKDMPLQNSLSSSSSSSSFVEMKKKPKKKSKNFQKNKFSIFSTLKKKYK
ncbi:dual adapter for phosphotyrosine and 3-phosphotyrosine and 3-phosphoinositide [Anaeramoeba flamelloides]|uniref:Dual adapter for phosphotyrosine and 3-phosphotyrosine and 3-phosphoinositide n=1 Tax=Anaeramoeba flamelloides TaxID=1746091 RepID=A0AAV7YA34_9EUKA|nr:dual adapter for phosphotyrosine and 3-phosphotyrosine and 3-phosphoinositide [Anaeramoeba flamelloides]